MIRVPRLIVAVVLCAAAQLLSAQPSRALPANGVQIIIPGDPGGNMATLGRLLADSLTQVLVQPAIVVYRSGADGNIAATAVARAQPDGRTLLIHGSGMLVSPLVHPDAGYDPVRDFEPIARIASAPNVLLAHESLRHARLDELVRRPPSGEGRIAFASAGYSQTSHLAAELFMARTGARWLHVPYRSSSAALRGLVGGEVQLMFVPAGAVAGAVATGRVFPVAVAHPRRLASLPDVPTLEELGVRGADYSQWYGVFAPAGIPQALSSQLSDQVVRIFEDPAMNRRIRELGYEPTTAGRAEFAQFFSAEQKRAIELAREQGLKGESK